MYINVEKSSKAKSRKEYGLLFRFNEIHSMVRSLESFCNISDFISHRLYVIISSLCTPLRGKAYQPNTGLISTYSQIEAEDQPATSGVSCNQHVESLSHY